MLDPTVNCHECDYSRTGIASGAPCPECGTVPDPNVVILRGWSAPTSPWMPMVIGAVMCIIGLALWSPYGWSAMQPAYVYLPMGTFVLAAGWWRWRARSRGGDRQWVLSGEGVRVDGALRQQRIPWSDVKRVRIQPHVLSRWITIDIDLRLLSLALDRPRMHIRADQADMDRIGRHAAQWTRVVRRRVLSESQY